MICSSLYLLFFMSVILHKLTDFSTKPWYGLWGAGQKELIQLKKLSEELLAWKAEASVSIGKLEAEISIKTDMMNRLLEEKKAAPEAR